MEQFNKFQFVEQMKTAASVMEAAVLLYADACSILDGDLVALCYAVSSMECKESYGTILFDHLAAHGASLTGGQVTVVTVLQVHTDFLSSLHLELLHSSLGLGNIDLVVALHSKALLFLWHISLCHAFLERSNTFLRKHSFSFRKSIFADLEENINVTLRKPR